MGGGAGQRCRGLEPPWSAGPGTQWVIYNHRAHVPSSWLGQLLSLACPSAPFCQLTPPLAGLSGVQLEVLPRGP